MKAKFSNKNNEEEILLSIGMIVKNEEKVLRRCLESLKPLMKAVKSELIIADTGSTDSTVEIAKEFTDQVFYFEWINDFAAARNSTLEKARGKWFFFLDADEYLDDDIGEMIHFFSLPDLYNKYKTLEIMVRSYTDTEKKNFQDGCLARFQRIDAPDDPVHFVGAVHEGIWIRYPLGYFSTILHHTGYCFSSEKQNVSKKERNLAIMREEYKRNPEDIRMLCHLIDGTAFIDSEKERYISEGLNLMKKHRRHLYGNVLYMLAIAHYENKSPDFALKLCSEYYEGVPEADNYVATVAVTMFKAKILCALGRYDESIAAYEKYIELYDQYKNDKLIITDMSAHPVSGITELEYMKNIINYTLVLKIKKDYSRAYELLDMFDICTVKNEIYKEYIGTLRELCKEEKKYAKLAYYYEKVHCSSEKERRVLYLYMLESVYYSLITEKERMAFAADFAESSACGKYTELMRMVISQDTPDFKEQLMNFIISIDDWSDGYSEAIYLAVKHGVDISSAVLNMKATGFRTKLETIANANDDFAGYVLAYGMPETYCESIKQFAFLNAMYEKASYRSFELSDTDRLELYTRFVSLLGDYISNVYSSEILNPEDIDVLPPLYQFGYFMSEALKAQREGNKTGYVREMKHALQHCESMREIVSFMLEQFKKTL